MADRELSNKLSSGEITQIKIGGTAAGNIVPTTDEANAFDNSTTSLTSTTKQNALVELANVGYAHMVLNTPYTGGQTQSTTPAKISAFDTIHHNVNGAITPTVDTNESTHTHKFTIDKAGTYRVYGTVTAEFSSSNDITLELYKNGSPTGAKMQLQGRGAGKPVLFMYAGDLDFEATDYAELYAYADAASVSLLVTSSSVTLERKPI